MRTLVIGDIHGAYKALIQVLDRSGYDYKKDKLIFLGDYCDGFSETALLLSFLNNLKKETKGTETEIITLMGNHDEWVRDHLLFGSLESIWLTQGGRASYKSLFEWFKYNSEDRQTFIEFFEQCPYYYVDKENRAFVHGGYLSTKGCGYEKRNSVYVWDRTLLEEAWKKVISGKEQPERLKVHKEIYIGHTATTIYDKYVPINVFNLWNLDTGAGWGNRLTIMDVDTKEYWQSDPVRDLYPGEQLR